MQYLAISLAQVSDDNHVDNVLTCHSIAILITAAKNGRNYFHLFCYIDMQGFDVADSAKRIIIICRPITYFTQAFAYSASILLHI
jgi:hypothetical protein